MAPSRLDRALDRQTGYCSQGAYTPRTERQETAKKQSVTLTRESQMAPGAQKKVEQGNKTVGLGRGDDNVLSEEVTL